MPPLLRLSSALLHNAGEVLPDNDVLVAELWASTWLGQAWAAAENPELATGRLTAAEEGLAMEVVARTCDHPSPSGRAAVTALARLAAVPEPALTAALARLDRQPAPTWETAPGWQPVSAAQAVSVWGDRRLVSVEFAGPVPHALGASVHQVGGTLVTGLVITFPGAREAYDRHPPATPGMPEVMQDVDPAEALADLAAALRSTDRCWPRQDEESVVTNRAVAWQRVAAYLPDEHEPVPLTSAEGDDLVADFLAGRRPGEEPDRYRYVSRRTHRGVTRSLVRLFLEFGETDLAHPLAWSPAAVGLLLAEVLPSQHWLDSRQRYALRPVLEGWIRFALDRRGLAPEWIEPVVDAVAEFHPVFLDRHHDQGVWSLGKHLAAAQHAQALDLVDPAEAMRQLRTLIRKRDGTA